MARDALAPVRPEYADPEQPPSGLSAAPADDVVRALNRLNHTLELELAVLRVEQAAEQLRAIAQPWRRAA